MRVVGLEAVAAVEGEAVHGHALGDPDADRGDLLVALHSADPDAGAALDPLARHAELGEHVDEHALESAHVADHVDRFGEPEDRVADELARPVPGDLAAAVDIDDGGAVGRPFVGLGAFAGGVHRRVLEEDDGIGRPACDDGGVHGTLLIEGLGIRHGVGA